MAAAAAEGMKQAGDAADGPGGRRLAGEVGRCILSASMGCDAGVIATFNHFKPPGRKIGVTDRQMAQKRAEIVAQLRAEMDTFIRMADVKLLKAKLHQQRNQNKKLMTRNRALLIWTSACLCRQ